jgi:monoamine oxidase
MPRLSFVLSDDPVMPTWWTSYPVLAPVLTGWVGGPRAARLGGESDAGLAEQALAALARVLHVPRVELDARLVDWHVHNWTADPFSRGAYSYVRVGGLEAPARLAQPVQRTLYFSGEATDDHGHTGTVHAALAAGQRAARALIAQI